MTTITGEFRTSNLGLAVVLSINGHRHARLELMDGESALWVYDESDELMSLIESYESDDLRVEPRAFMKRLGAVRREMYRFLERNSRRGVAQAR